MVEIKFEKFAIEKREHSPNAVIGIILTNEGIEKRIYICTPSVSLGKKVGDKFAEDIKDYLETEYC